MAEQTLLDLDSMLDSSLDAIPDAPDFMNPPDGLYRIAVKEAKVDSYTQKDTGNQIPRLKIIYVVLATVETKEIPVPDGSMFSETFQATEQGLGYFKSRAKGILNVSDIAGVPLKAVLESLVGTEFDAKISTRKTSKDGKEYENLVIRVVPNA